MKFASPGRLSTTRIPVAPAARARWAFETNVQVPRETSAIDPASEPFGSVLGPPFGSDAGPAEQAVDRPPVGADDRADVATT